MEEWRKRDEMGDEGGGAKIVDDDEVQEKGTTGRAGATMLSNRFLPSLSCLGT